MVSDGQQSTGTIWTGPTPSSGRHHRATLCWRLLADGRSIGDADDDLGRMLGCLRFWFTKDLKYVKGKPCKPYNSTLGEFFRCNWKVDNTTISYLTEQTSHHPPVSAFYVDCPEKGITARGFDQLSAKFTGTSVRVVPGSHNLGIFVTLKNRGNEEYQLTHPAAYLGGFLRGERLWRAPRSDRLTLRRLSQYICRRYLLRHLPEDWVEGHS
jgi:hypothetical protein